MDDFGTGYSSLNYIRRFPVDILKVDKSFVDGVSEGGEESALTAAIIELAGILNLRPVAEGIERADQLEKLLELKCELGQGYYFSEPLPFDGAAGAPAEPADPRQQGRGADDLALVPDAHPRPGRMLRQPARASALPPSVGPGDLRARVPGSRHLSGGRCQPSEERCSRPT